MALHGYQEVQVGGVKVVHLWTFKVNYHEKYKNILTYRIWSTKYPKYAQTLALVGVSKKLVAYSNIFIEKSNRIKKDSILSTGEN